MITEDYVSFEVAKLLKEKGFDESISMVYMPYGDLCKLDRYDSIRNSNYNDITKSYFEYTAPTLQMAMKWLREVHNIHCDIGYDDCDWFWNIVTIDKNVPVEDRPLFIKIGLAGYESYEEACETAIKWCLEKLF